MSFVLPDLGAPAPKPRPSVEAAEAIAAAEMAAAAELEAKAAGASQLPPIWLEHFLERLEALGFSDLEAAGVEVHRVAFAALRAALVSANMLSSEDREAFAHAMGGPSQHDSSVSPMVEIAKTVVESGQLVALVKVVLAATPSLVPLLLEAASGKFLVREDQILKKELESVKAAQSARSDTIKALLG